jgi:hypothetical protein
MIVEAKQMLSVSFLGHKFMGLRKLQNKEIMFAVGYAVRIIVKFSSFQSRTSNQ